jgi:hypothetical protein
MRVPKRSMSRLAIGTMASAMRPGQRDVGREAGQVDAVQDRHVAREGGQRACADLGLAGADEATISVPLRLRSACEASVTSIRPPERVRNPSRISG